MLATSPFWMYQLLQPRAALVRAAIKIRGRYGSTANLAHALLEVLEVHWSKTSGLTAIDHKQFVPAHGLTAA